VVLHEFAHQLDGEDEDLDGTPALSSAADYASWSKVMEDEFDALEEAAARGEKTLIDPYGTKNPAEFFAVVTECFFERPTELSKRHPALYGELKRFYHQDPASWGVR
jgi:Mlc titration factor MtfA (ptsG expression regulator)